MRSSRFFTSINSHADLEVAGVLNFSSEECAFRISSDCASRIQYPFFAQSTLIQLLAWERS